MPASGVRAAEGGGSKESPKRDVVISSLRYLIGGCARGAELTAMAPLNLPNKWARILRMSSAPKIQIDDFLQVIPGRGMRMRRSSTQLEISHDKRRGAQVLKCCPGRKCRVKSVENALGKEGRQTLFQFSQLAIRLKRGDQREGEGALQLQVDNQVSRAQCWPRQ